MRSLKLNGEEYIIKSLSELNFKEFNDVVIKNEVFDLKDYIALFSNMKVEEVMNSKIETASFPALHNALFDVDIEFKLKEKKQTFTYKGETYILDEMSLDTFGKVYYFDLYYTQFQSEKMNLYELSMMALAIYIANTSDMDKVKEVYSELSEMKWTEVLPTGFFLAKKFWKKKRGSILLWIRSTLELKRISLKVKSQIKILRAMEKS